MTLLPLRASSVVLALLVAGRLQAQQTQQMGGNGNSVVAGCQQSATRQLVSSHPGADSVTYDANPTISGSLNRAAGVNGGGAFRSRSSAQWTRFTYACTYKLTPPQGSVVTVRVDSTGSR